MGLGWGRGRAIEEIYGVEEGAGPAALGAEAAAELLDLVAALPGGLGRGGRGGHCGPVGGGQVRAADREAASRVGAGEGEGLVCGPARQRHAPAGGRCDGEGRSHGDNGEVMEEEGMVRGL